MTTNGEILFSAEISDGGLHRSALELSALSRRLADKLDGLASALLIVGAGGKDLASDLISYGADRVYVVEDNPFEGYQPEAYSLAIERVSQQVNPDLLLFGHTLHGVDLAPRLAWRLKAGLAAR